MKNRQSIRLKDYDYAKSGLYFVTIDVQDKFKLFWNNEFKLNDSGKMVEKAILEISEFYDGIGVDTYVVMPDHIHLIIEITNVGADSHIRPMDQKQNISLPEIIQRFKILTTNKYILGVKSSNWLCFHKRLWQRNYYERIIRNEEELKRVRTYVEENPRKWIEKI